MIQPGSMKNTGTFNFPQTGRKHTTPTAAPAFTATENGTAFTKTSAAAAFQSLADTLGVEEEKQPDFTEPCIWARLSGEGGDYLVMLFVPEENKLFVAERLI